MSLICFSPHNSQEYENQIFGHKSVRKLLLTGYLKTTVSSKVNWTDETFVADQSIGAKQLLVNTISSERYELKFGIKVTFRLNWIHETFG